MIVLEATQPSHTPAHRLITTVASFRTWRGSQLFRCEGTELGHHNNRTGRHLFGVRIIAVLPQFSTVDVVKMDLLFDEERSLCEQASIATPLQRAHLDEYATYWPS